MKSIKLTIILMFTTFIMSGCSLKEISNSLNKSTVDEIAKTITDRTQIKDSQGSTITYYPAKPKAATHEDQEYTVTVKVMKGGELATTTFTEKVPFDPALKQKFIDDENCKIAQGVADKINTRGAKVEGFDISYFPAMPKSASSEDQTYNVVVTVNKDGSTATHKFVETVLCDPRLRDEADQKFIANLAANINSRDNKAIDGVTYTYEPAQPKKATATTQTYDVKVTITKGNQSITTTFQETVSFDKELRLKNKVQNMTNELKNALESQSISLEEREEYKKHIQNMIVVVLEERVLNVQARKELIGCLMDMRDLLVSKREEEIKQILKENQRVIDSLREDLKARDIAINKREDLNLQIAKLIEQILNDRSRSVEQRNQDIQKLLQLRDALIEQRKLMMEQVN